MKGILWILRWGGRKIDENVNELFCLVPKEESMGVDSVEAWRRGKAMGRGGGELFDFCQKKESFDKGDRD